MIIGIRRSRPSTTLRVFNIINSSSIIVHLFNGKMESTLVYWDYIGVMEEKLETTMLGLVRSQPFLSAGVCVCLSARLAVRPSVRLCLCVCVCVCLCAYGKFPKLGSHCCAPKYYVGAAI